MQMEAARGGGLDTGRRELKPSFSPVSSYLLSKLPVVVVGVCLCVCVRACVDRDTWLAAVHGVTKSRTEPLNKGPRLKKGPPQWAFEVRLSQSPPFFSCLGTTSVQEYGGGGGEADPWPRQEHRRSALGGKGSVVPGSPSPAWPLWTDAHGHTCLDWRLLPNPPTPQL